MEKIQFERAGLQNRLNTAFIKGDSDQFAEIIDEMVTFNRKYPSEGFDADGIRQSLVKRATQRATSKAGVILTKKNLAIPGFAQALKSIE